MYHLTRHSLQKPDFALFPLGWSNPYDTRSVRIQLQRKSMAVHTTRFVCWQPQTDFSKLETSPKYCSTPQAVFQLEQKIVGHKRNPVAIFPFYQEFQPFLHLSNPTHISLISFRHVIRKIRYQMFLLSGTWPIANISKLQKKKKIFVRKMEILEGFDLSCK